MSNSMVSLTCEGFLGAQTPGPHPWIGLAHPSSGLDLASVQHRFDIDFLIWPYFDAKSTPEEGRARRIRGRGPGLLCLISPSQGILDDKAVPVLRTPLSSKGHNHPVLALQQAGFRKLFTRDSWQSGELTLQCRVTEECDRRMRTRGRDLSTTRSHTKRKLRCSSLICEDFFINQWGLFGIGSTWATPKLVSITIPTNSLVWKGSSESMKEVKLHPLS